MGTATEALADDGTPFDGRHRLISRIARGAMGEVYLAHDDALDRPVALKRLRRQALQVPDSAEHFGDEYRVLSRLRHPRIIEVYDYGIHEGLPYYTMELLDGADLRKLAPMPYREACRCLRDVASSLALLHARRLLHRDVSPRNVRRTTDGRCKLLDFGTLTGFGLPKNVAGTPPFVPPEALRGAALDQRADLYSLGALAYWLLTGHHAHDVKMLEDLPASWKKRPPSTRKHLKEIPQALDDLVLSLLQVAAVGRPSTASEVIEALTGHGELEAEESPEEVGSYLAGAALVGRDAAMEAVVLRIDRALTGHGAAVAIDGSAGIGKTRLLSEAVLAGRLRGLAVVNVSARECQGERGLARELVNALDRVAPSVAASARSGLEADLGLLLAPVGTRTVHAGGEARARAQSGVAEWFARVAREQPLLVAVDDLDQADEFSYAFVTAIGLAAANLPLLVLCTIGGSNPGERPAAINSFVAMATRLPLAALDEAQTAELMEAFFGDAPNLDRASRWMFRNAHGNPALCAELARHLIERGEARFRTGLWVLPDHDITVDVPGELREAFAMRFKRLPEEARRVAALIALHGGSLSVALLAATLQQGDEALQPWLHRLERDGILRRSGSHWVFGLAAMREAAELSLTPETKSELHARLADALLANDKPEAEAMLLAGWHLVHTESELRGADILASVGPRMMREGLGAVTAVRAMERALEVYERLKVPLAKRLRLAAHLIVGGYIVDPAVALRWGQPTVDALYRASGLGLAERLSKHIGSVGLYVAIVSTSIARLFVPRSRRPPPIVLTLTYLCRATMGLVAVRCSGLDAPGTRALSDLLTPLAKSRLPVARETALACYASSVQPWGREADAEAAYATAIEELNRLPARATRSATAGDVGDMLVGLWLARGINACYRPGPAGLEMAVEIEALGTQQSGVCADRVRMVYYTVRGYRDEAEHYKRRIELLAVQGGSSWQVNVFTAPVEGIAAVFYGDLVASRRALERLELIVKVIPSMLPMRNLCRLTLLYGRGQYEEAVKEGLAFIEAHPPRTLIGWAVGYAAVVGALAELGRHEEALEISTRGLAAAPDADREYYIMYALLEGMHALVLGMAGHEVQSEALLVDLEDRLRAHHEYSSLALLAQNRARVARITGDLSGMRIALNLMEEAARQSRNPALVANASRLFALSNQMASGAAPSTLPARRSARKPSAASQPAAEQTIVARVLHDCGPGDRRARQALRLVAQYAGASRGYLLVPDGKDGVRVAATLGPSAPPPALERRLGELLSAEHGESYSQVRAHVPGGDGTESLYGAFLLPDGTGGSVGVVALEEGDEPLAQVPQDILLDVGRALR